MHVRANQLFRLTREASVKTLDGKAMPGATLKTLVPPKPGRDGEDKILVVYQGQGRPGEARSGGKFWIRVSMLGRYAEPTS